MVSGTDPINSVPQIQILELCLQSLVRPPGTGGNFTDLPLQCAKHSPCIVSLNAQKSRGLTIGISLYHQVVEAVKSCV